MKKFIFLFTLLMLNFALAALTEKDLIQCEDQIQSFGDGKGYDEINVKCIDSYLNASNSNSVKITSDKSLSVFGHGNLIIMKGKKIPNLKSGIIAGESTMLKDILAIEVDEKNQELVVLEKSGDLLFFSLALTGNVAPLRVIKSKELYGAVDITIDGETDEVLILNPHSKEIFRLNRLSNYFGKKHEKQARISKVVDDISGTSIDLSPQGLLIKDGLNQRIIPLRKPASY